MMNDEEKYVLFNFLWSLGDGLEYMLNKMPVNVEVWDLKNLTEIKRHLSFATRDMASYASAYRIIEDKE